MDLRAEATARSVRAEIASALCFAQGIPQARGSERVFRADEHDAGSRTDGEACQGETLKHSVWVLLHEQAIRIRTRVSLIAIGHHHPGLRVLQRGPPFGGCAEPGTAAPPQMCRLDLEQNVLGCSGGGDSWPHGPRRRTSEQAGGQHRERAVVVHRDAWCRPRDRSTQLCRQVRPGTCVDAVEGGGATEAIAQAAHSLEREGAVRTPATRPDSERRLHLGDMSTSRRREARSRGADPNMPVSAGRGEIGEKGCRSLDSCGRQTQRAGNLGGCALRGPERP
jgi:hypothetical protein